jgi:hypothetical protein
MSIYIYSRHPRTTHTRDLVALRVSTVQDVKDGMLKTPAISSMSAVGDRRHQSPTVLTMEGEEILLYMSANGLILHDESEDLNYRTLPAVTLSLSRRRGQHLLPRKRWVWWLLCSGINLPANRGNATSSPNTVRLLRLMRQHVTRFGRNLDRIYRRMINNQLFCPALCVPSSEISDEPENGPIATETL